MKDPIQPPFRLSARNGEEISLRPSRLAEFIGQERVTSNLNVFIQASLKRGDPLDHVLFYGPPGLGKTTLAHIIAQEMKSNIRFLSGPSLSRAGDLASILTSISPLDVVFIDEIHRLPPACEEILYGAMEDFSLDIVVGKGPGARSIRISLPPFTLVGATTRVSLLSSPLRSRFGIVEKLDFYREEELAAIVTRTAQVMDINLLPEGAREIACRSRGTPRVANRLLKRVRDFAQYFKKEVIDLVVVKEAFQCLEIDALGLTPLDRKFLQVLVEVYRGGPVGIQTLAVVLGEEAASLEEMYEPFLVKAGFLARTPRGRVATPRGRKYVLEMVRSEG
ncbi:MAG: holliday junction helicase RuvB [Candidatus Atribacteria bacterium]|nr:holliday junction helicase RuvB [Candidatus Atribacteria bacterium]